MSATSNSVQSGVGSILLMDSTIYNSVTGVLLRNNPPPNMNDVSGTLLLDNVQVNNVTTVVQDTDGNGILISNGQQTIASWGRGSVYKDDSGQGTFSTDYLPSITKSPSLLDSEGRFFHKSRPQYEQVISSDFVSVKGEYSIFVSIIEEIGMHLLNSIQLMQLMEPEVTERPMTPTRFKL